MKKIVLLAGSVLTAFVLAGCNKDTGQGGTSDQYGTSSGSSSNYNYNAGQSSGTNSYDNQNNQGAATSPGGQSSGKQNSDNDASRTNAYNTGTGVR